MELSKLTFSQLSQEAKVGGFDCTSDDITCFLRNDALQYQSQRIANTYLFTDKDGNIVAFFSVSNDCVNDLGSQRGYTNVVWNRLHRAIKLPNTKRIRQYPAVKIVRLGVHKEYQKTGLAYQLMDFIKRWIISDQKPACRLLTLDAINQSRQLKYYDLNKFQYLLDSDVSNKTRLMYFDLIELSISHTI